MWLWCFVWLIPAGGCDLFGGILLPPRDGDYLDTDGMTLVARLVHITDAHLVDEESPARFANGHDFTLAAWRPYESSSTQLFDGIVRAINRIHASGRTIDFVIFTGDACDNAQANELSWFLTVMDGGIVDPRSGPDDRPVEDRPDPALDPHAPFQAQGLYRRGLHGDEASISWYTLLGNHDAYAIGLFPIVESWDGNRFAPLPLPFRPGLLLPTVFDPTGSWTHGKITPADPGPPQLLEWPCYVESNPQRAYFNRREFIAAMFQTQTGPAGHGFSDPEQGSTWYSVAPVPGLRLIGLNTSDWPATTPGAIHEPGAVSGRQVAFLQQELEAANQRGEIVIVASHHPSTYLGLVNPSAMVGIEFRELLNAYPNVVMHLAAHMHRNRVIDWGGYLEIETCSTLDLPQEGRLIEVWQDESSGTVVVNYEVFSHFADGLPELGEDPLRGLREAAYETALGVKWPLMRTGARSVPFSENPQGTPADRSGISVRYPSD